MRTEKDINAELDSTLAAYREASATKPAHEAAPLSRRVKALRIELGQALSAGADPCPDCRETPTEEGKEGAPVAAFGMRRNFSLTRTLVVSLVEVGCPSCPKRAIGLNTRLAVEAWNAGEYAPENADAMPAAVAQVWARAAEALG